MLYKPVHTNIIASAIFAFFPFLRRLALQNTSVTMEGLRAYAATAEPLKRSPRPQIGVPTSCRDYLDEVIASKHYAYRIDDPYILISDSDAVDTADGSKISENLKYHERLTGKSLAAEDAETNREQLRKLLQQRYVT